MVVAPLRILQERESVHVRHREGLVLWVMIKDVRDGFSLTGNGRKNESVGTRPSP